jgi:hypothetical protein
MAGQRDPSSHRTPAQIKKMKLRTEKVATF